MLSAYTLHPNDYVHPTVMKYSVDSKYIFKWKNDRDEVELVKLSFCKESRKKLASWVDV